MSKFNLSLRDEVRLYGGREINPVVDECIRTFHREFNISPLDSVTVHQLMGRFREVITRYYRSNLFRLESHVTSPDSLDVVIKRAAPSKKK